MGTALSWQGDAWVLILLSLLSQEIILLFPLPVTNDGVQQSYLLCPGVVFLVHSLTALQLPLASSPLTDHLHKALNLSRQNFLGFLSLRIEGPPRPPFLAYMHSPKMAEVFDCLLTEHFFSIFFSLISLSNSKNCFR